MRFLAFIACWIFFSILCSTLFRRPIEYLARLALRHVCGPCSVCGDAMFFPTLGARDRLSDPRTGELYRCRIVIPFPLLDPKIRMHRSCYERLIPKE